MEKLKEEAVEGEQCQKMLMENCAHIQKECNVVKRECTELKQKCSELKSENYSAIKKLENVEVKLKIVEAKHDTLANDFAGYKISAPLLTEEAK